MRLRLFAGLCALIAVAAAEVSAQSRVGTAIVDGRTVHLFSDQSWRYADASPTDCATIAKSLDFCAERGAWSRLDASGNPNITALFANPQEQYLMFIVENIGSTSGMSLDIITEAVLTGVAEATNSGGAASIPVLSTEDREFEGHPARRIVYSVDIDGLEFVYINTMVVGESFTDQFITYQFASKPLEDLRRVHEAVLAAVRLK